MDFVRVTESSTDLIYRKEKKIFQRDPFYEIFDEFN